MKTNRNLAITALVLGSLALVAGRAGQRVSIDPEALAHKIQNELDHVDPSELAEWIAVQRRDYRLIDLRDSASFTEYHIPNAQNIGLTDLMKTKFKKDETIVLYSQGGVHSAQAMFLLWTKGYQNVLMLRGGIEGWNADVLHKDASEGKSPSGEGRSKPSQPAAKPALKEEEKFRREC